MISPARRRIVFAAIKAAILKGSEVEYWALRMYEQQEAGVLTDEQVAELEVLIEEYYNPPEPPEVTESAEGGETEPEPADGGNEAQEAPEPLDMTPPDYDSMTKHELYEWAEARGIVVYESWTKAEIVAAIQAALGQGGEQGEASE